MVPKKSQFSPKVPNFAFVELFLRKVPNSKSCIGAPASSPSSSSSATSSQLVIIIPTSLYHHPCHLHFFVKICFPRLTSGGGLFHFSGAPRCPGKNHSAAKKSLSLLIHHIHNHHNSIVLLLNTQFS